MGRKQIENEIKRKTIKVNGKISTQLDAISVSAEDEINL